MGDLNYYELLGLESGRVASTEEIKRAYVQKRRTYQGDDEKITLLNQAYEVLLDADKRQEYDSSNQIQELFEEYNNEDDYDSRKEILKEINCVLEASVGKDDEHNLVAFKDLITFERIYGRDDIKRYLDKMQEILDRNTKISDRTEWLSYVGNLYYLYEDVDGAIKAYYQLFKIQAPDEEITNRLVNLVCEKKRKFKAAVQILHDCINKTDDDTCKAFYLCKTYEILSQKGETYDKAKDAILSKLMKLIREPSGEINFIAYAGLLTGLVSILEDEKVDVVSNLEDYFENILYDKNIDQVPQIKFAKKIVKELKDLVSNIDATCIDSILEDELTDKKRDQIQDYLLTDFDNVKKAINDVKKYAPTLFNSEEYYIKVYNILNSKDKLIRELSTFYYDDSFCPQLRFIIRVLTFDEFTRFLHVADYYYSSVDYYFSKDRLIESREELRRLASIYPECYKIFSNTFFDGETITELLGDEQDDNNLESNEYTTKLEDNVEHYEEYPYARPGYENKPFFSGIIEIAAIISATIVFFPSLFIILGIKVFNRYTAIIIACVIKLIKVIALIIAFLLVFLFAFVFLI
ncbi:J domain-containing protein [Pseudobutyrivibrio xylanivorans]|uniref:J domain-containing protein n=1 Tax=Pseudobutyrivibrio xylanivorans TaxID=185007 RepID=UPI00142ECB09|nr:DnaJ domain-containing protein [Pseudobutyrivibrio xylanivorans]